MTEWTSIIVEQERGIGRVTLNRPKRRNAFDAQMATELCEGFERLARERSLRVVILAGAGPMFCAGADVRWFHQERPPTAGQAREDAERLAAMYQAIDRCPCPVIGRVQGAAFGGGVGLLAVCDVVVAVDDATLTLSELQLGVLPAIIGPYLLRKAGASFMQRYSLTGTPFSAADAQRFHLVHDVVARQDLDTRVDELAEAVVRLAPEATRHTKRLIKRLQAAPESEQERLAIEASVQSRLSAEAQEGLRAFVEKRPPVWRQEGAGSAIDDTTATEHHAAARRR